MMKYATVSILLEKKSVEVLKPEPAVLGSRDLCVVSPIDMVVKPGEVRNIPLGYSLILPKDTELVMYPKAGANPSISIVFANKGGVIDSKFREEVVVEVRNRRPAGSEPLRIHRGDKLGHIRLFPEGWIDLVVAKSQF